ncbi:uncharacterized protein [Polyergus mexicanus]|uniref:uncharacterized protein n=1 Tax=Polyergus mexicanus TaxID=615972 RepID=UPI0038B5EA84
MIKCRALLDTCATANFISERLARHLKLPITSCALPVGAINSMNTVSKGIIQITIQSLHNEFRKNLLCLSIPIISDLVPSEIFPRHSIKIPSNIKLADPEFHLPRPIDLLIGAGTTLSLFSIGQIDLSQGKHDLYLQKTRLGWIVAGGITPRKYPKKVTCQLSSLEQQIAKFWTIEELTTDTPKTTEELECEAHFAKNVTRDNSGRYMVRLPFRKGDKRLGDSRVVALKRLNSLERKLDSDAILKTAYSQTIQEYLDLKQMSPINDSFDDGFYMPHHAVVKSSSNTTKIRVVFDASAKSTTGTSLNDMLMVGPTLQETLFTHLIRFRTYRYVLTADIEKMYRQILLHEDDRIYQRILWRQNKHIKTFQLNTLTFGVSSSPYLAIRTVQKLADDEGDAYPIAARVLKTHLYVDDLLTGTNTISEARALRDDIITLLSRGGFNIRQWASNDKRIINDLTPDAMNSNLILDKDNSLKTLGIAWRAYDDMLHYSVRSIDRVERITKRIIFSEVAKIFDPLGILGPIILHAKKLMQNLWRCKLDWDESIPPSIHTAWTDFAIQLDSLKELSINRQVLSPDYTDVQFHGFCDASNVGYGACLYIRSNNRNNDVHCHLLCAKSRVAPLKSVTIPRLELCGALLLAKLYREVHRAFRLSPNKTVLWSDSTIVLHWIKTSPHLLKTYVSHRVAQIQEIIDLQVWQHIKSEDNPADALSRGQLPNAFLNNRSWFSGPAWLINEEDEWPIGSIKLNEIPELRKNTCFATVSNDCSIFEKYSSYSRLLRVIALCLRFRIKNTYREQLCMKEIDEAETRIIKIIQASYFSRERNELTNKRSIKKSNIAALNPFIDENGIIRVGGRLKMSELTFTQKHPILLPSRHFLTDLIIKETHEKYYHAGIQTTLYTIRRKFWLLDGRNQVRKVVRSCIRCFRYRADPTDYKMSNLPKIRVRNASPFANTGIDYCGPFYIKEKKYRNRNKIKVYVCVFVCMAVKAVHLEVVSDLTTDGFLAALRRFIARRGIPAHIYSDNGTNFRGANNHLKELYVLFNSDEHQKRMNRFSTKHHITWHFIPPIAPHFGGLWESTVKLFKHHFKRVVGEILFTFEELNTFTVEIEGILNSRPISSLSSDPNDPLVLTPAHCLIGRPLINMPEPDLSSVPANRLSTWQHITKVKQDFWARWSLEYLNELQVRRKWIKDGEKIDLGTIVLIKEKNLPCTQWALGKVVEIHPGEDGIVRAVKTAMGTLKRAVKYLCPLPIERYT